MAFGTEQTLFLKLGDLYVRAVSMGLETVDVHITWIAEVLDYLDPENTRKSKIYYPLDDMPVEGTDEWRVEKGVKFFE